MPDATWIWNDADALAQGVLNSFIDASPDVVRIVGLDGRVQWLNREGKRLLQVSEFERLRGQPWASLWPIEARGRVTAALTAAAAGRTGRFEARCPTSAGADRWWETVVTPVSAAGGRIVCYLATSRDITELHGFRTAGATPAPAAVRLDSIQHDLLTPLHGLRGMIALLRGTPLNAEQQAMLNSVCASADALATALDVEEEPVAAAAPDVAGRTTAGRAPQVLVVDDNHVNRTMLRLAFEAVGVRVTDAENGADACDLCAEEVFDLVVMDLQMPVMDGLSALRNIRTRETVQERSRTPVVVFTASGGADCEYASRAAGADAFLTKPLAPATLLSIVSPILEASAAPR